MTLKDPMLIQTPPHGRELFQRLAKECGGVPADIVITAAANIFVNAIRQAYPSREAAEKAFDELLGKTKGILMSHYDSFGRVKGVFPYDQVIQFHERPNLKTNWRP